MEIVTKYFPQLTARQAGQLAQLEGLYGSRNARVNLISRRDIGQLYERHVLHSLAIAKAVAFAGGARILDVGTGGGFPGVPLAILFPQCAFTLVDSIGKKVAVVREVAAALGLRNVAAVHGRVEALPGAFDFAVSRAVAGLPVLVGWVWGKLVAGGGSSLRNGLLCLKGGDLREELRGVRLPHAVTPLSDFFAERWFETKQLVYVER